MAEPRVSLLLQLVDKLTEPMNGAKGALDSFTAKAKNVGNEIAALAKSKLGLASIAATVGLAISKSISAFDEARAAQLRLEGTAKITGVSLGFLQDIAERAAKTFSLGKADAADFAVEMAKLAAKAGDVGKAGPALQAFLDIGAARGLSAKDTLKAVQQAILGIDEGTDKLFNANPSVLYERFAESIGTTAGKLTDQQKAQALLTAAMEDGAKVTGRYGSFLETTAGQSQALATASERLFVRIGALLDPIRQVGLFLLEWLVKGGEAVVQVFEVIGMSALATFQAIPNILQGALGGAANLLGGFVNLVAKVAGPLRDEFEAVGKSIQGWGESMKATATNDLKVIGTAWTDRMGEIYNVASDGERKITAATIAGSTQRTAATKAGLAERQKAEADSAKELAKLREDERKALLELETIQRREYLELIHRFHESKKKMTVEDQAEADRLLKAAHDRLILKWAGLDTELKPVMRGLETTIKGPILEFGNVVTATTEEAGDDFEQMNARIASTAYGIADAAFAMSNFAQQAGVADSQIAGLAEGIGRLAEGIGGIASGNLLGGIQSAVMGLQGILGSLLGDSPAERARKALLERNTDALRALERSNGLLLRSQSTGAQIDALKKAIPGFEAAAAIQGDSSIINRSRFQMFRGILQQQGIGLSDAERIAKEIDVDLDTSTGELSAGILRQFIDGLRTAKFGSFEESFGGALDQLDFESKLAGGFTSGQQLSRLQSILAGPDGAPAIAAAFDGLDLGSEAGRATLLGRIQSLGLNITNLSDAQRGGLTGREFTDILTRIAELLRTGDFAAPTETGAIPGIPTGSSSSFTAPSVTQAATTADALAVFTQIEVNTRATAEGVAITNRLLAQAGGGTLIPDEMLATYRDLFNASQGGA